ncbi:hypothetical protein O9993_21350 [Vibrio lentus]|nr:hypothetical protein [Vibrio lentus]
MKYSKVAKNTIPNSLNGIETLSERQQLFLERFVSLNANEHQVSLMVEVFRNDVFACLKPKDAAHYST